MIQGKSKTEANYRAIYLDSSSSLKDFLLDRKKYHKKYILNEDVADSESAAANMGRIVETLLMEKEEMDNRFMMSAISSPPTGLMLSFIEALYKITVDATDDKGNVTREFSDMAQEAYALSGFKIKFEAVLSKFIGSDAEIYYKEIREMRSKGLTVVTSAEVSMAEYIVEELRTNPVTAELVNLTSSSRWEIRNQCQVEGYMVDGHLFKSMMDKVIIDHKEKVVKVYDLKCTWNVENFYNEYYLKRRAYIQAYLYKQAALYMVSKEESLEGYRVENICFIVCDSGNYLNPLIYTVDDDDMDDAYNGFSHNGREYTGVKEIIENLIWAQDNNVWNMSKKNHENGGIVKLKG